MSRLGVKPWLKPSASTLATQENQVRFNAAVRRGNGSGRGREVEVERERERERERVREFHTFCIKKKKWNTFVIIRTHDTQWFPEQHA